MDWIKIDSWVCQIRLNSYNLIKSANLEYKSFSFDLINDNINLY